MSDAMLPFLPRPSTSLYTRDLRNKVERHTSVRKSGEDEPDLAEETYHPIIEVIHQKTYNLKQINHPEHRDDDDSNTERFDFFV
jgi:gas vesicle protein